MLHLKASSHIDDVFFVSNFIPYWRKQIIRLGDYMDILARLAGLARFTGIARLHYKLYVFSTLRLHDSARLGGLARFAGISLFASGLARFAGMKNAM